MCLQAGEPPPPVRRALQEDRASVASTRHRWGHRPRSGGQSDAGCHRLAAPVMFGSTHLDTQLMIGSLCLSRPSCQPISFLQPGVELRSAFRDFFATLWICLMEAPDLWPLTNQREAKTLAPPSRRQEVRQISFLNFFIKNFVRFEF